MTADSGSIGTIVVGVDGSDVAHHTLSGVSVPTKLP
jgi:hypothetical protein